VQYFFIIAQFAQFEKEEEGEHVLKIIRALSSGLKILIDRTLCQPSPVAISWKGRGDRFFCSGTAKHAPGTQTLFCANIS
jgi:hypothetical protein